MKKNVGIIIAFIVISKIAGGQYIDEARELIRNERFNSAEILLEKNISNNPDPELNYMLVNVYLEQDKKGEAGTYINNYLGAEVSSSSDPLNIIAVARYLLNTGNKMQAEEMLDLILKNKKNQKNITLLLSMAEVLIKENDGDAKKALELLNMAEKKGKNNAEIDIEKGRAYLKLNDANNAFLSYRQAISKDPSDARAYYLMGEIFKAQNNTDVYLKYFLEAYHVDSTYAPVLEELYNHYYFRDVRTARKYLEKYIANTDYSLQNDYSLVDILYLNGDHYKAIKLAKQIIEAEQNRAQPRLYKLIAYSYANEGDSTKAFQYMTDFFSRQDSAKLISRDFEFLARLYGRNPGEESEAINYFSRAVDMDTLVTRKAEYASAIAELYKRKEDFAGQAAWLEREYQWEGKINNVDLFNLGLAYYRANNYTMADSVFRSYTASYPKDIYGYYWLAQIKSVSGSESDVGLAAFYYNQVVEIGEKDKMAVKSMLLKAYGYLGAYQVNKCKDYLKGLEWFEKYHDMDSENNEIIKYIDILSKWVKDSKGK